MPKRSASSAASSAGPPTGSAGPLTSLRQNLVEALQTESEEIDVMAITTVQDVNKMQERQSEEIDWMTVTEEVEQDMEEHS